MKLSITTALAIATLASLPAAAGAQTMTSKEEKSSMKTIVEVAKEAGTFNTLVTALQAAGLVETLQGKGPFTVFAPSDEAFAKLPAGTIEALLKDKQKLAAVLTFHVLPGQVMAADVLKAHHLEAATVNGEPLRVSVKDGKVYVNGARVVGADVAASNGVIHVIDAVLLPAAKPVPAGR